MFGSFGVGWPLTVNEFKSFRAKGQIKYITVGTGGIGGAGNHNIDTLYVEFADLIGNNLPEWYMVGCGFACGRTTINFRMRARRSKESTVKQGHHPVSIKAHVPPHSCFQNPHAPFHCCRRR